jgi:hypothetical protein
MDPNGIIRDFDKFLFDRKLTFSAVAIGGTALNLLGVVSRETKDCDILDPKLPEAIVQASLDFSKTQNGLIPNWLNNGPDSLKKHLPLGWEKRLVSLFKGKAITFHTLSRSDLLNTKLYAYCDRQTDFEDCLALKPTREELLEALPWVQHQDANVDWPEHVEMQFKELASELGYEL